MEGRRPIGVGVVGAGLVTQAIHLPTLAALDGARVVSVMDIDAGLAERVAARAGAAGTTEAAAVIGDPQVDVLLVCSPGQFHADQVVAACRAGKLVVLCEKPLAMTAEEARRIAEASAENAVPVVIGAMHTRDPGWLAARAVWAERPATAVSLTIVLPPNARFEDLATQVDARPVRPDTPPPPAADVVRGNVLGLLVHDLPLIRTLLPAGAVPAVRAARVHRHGCVIAGEAGGVPLVLRVVSTPYEGAWQLDWRLRVDAADAVLTVDFPPSYVHAGSASATLETRDGVTRIGPYDTDGYQTEWDDVIRIARGGAAPPIDTAIDDLRFAVELADRAATVAVRVPDPSPPDIADPCGTSDSGTEARATPYAVVLDEVARTTAVRRALASLPADLREVPEPPDEPWLAGVDGGPAWPARVAAAVAAGASGVLVVAAGAGDVPLTPGGVPVVLDTRWQHRSGVAEFRAWMASAVVISAAATGGAAPGRLAGTLDDLLRLVGAAMGEVSDLRPVTATGQHRTMLVTAGGVEVLVTVTESAVSADRARLDAFDGTTALRLDLPGPGTAEPARLLRTDATGSTLSPLVHETGLRAAWRRLAAAAHPLE